MNDNLRSGPLGATAQASKLSPRIVQLVPLVAALNGATTIRNAGALTVDPSEDRLITKAPANTFAFILPAYDKSCMGGDWVVQKVMVVVQTALATGGGDVDLSFDLGVYAFNSTTGALTAVDADGIVDGLTIAKTVAAGFKGAFVTADLNGAGGGAESYETAAGNTVSMKIGSGVAQFTAGDASVAGEDQILVLTNTASTGAGAYAVFVELKPVGGTAFKK